MSRIGVGEKIGFLLIKNKKPKGWRKEQLWLCECDCGKTCHVEHFKLYSGVVTSCGCQANKVKNKENSLKDTPEYRTYKSMIFRCYNPKDKSFSNYGAKGITVCQEWHSSFEKFLEDVGERPSDKHQLGRYDTSKGYFKDNCRWMTKREQVSKEKS